ncbi:uncharacterized protein LOC123674650 [Harmonia axyridis]|uniref:uncharacterized protein LOC123674650 n=1 Tax=Harmonia axyridis TaxID=115357 RepID=UPI001E27962E|nr:uncharacterized protein LOC123674650 [Harmonia axyridis]
MSKTSPFPSAFPVFRPRSVKSLIIEEDIIEKLGGGKICDIPATSTKPKVNVFPYWRPKKNLCLDYSLSQDHIIVDTRRVKIFARKTAATYDWNPKPVVPKAKRFKFGNGMMPPGQFVDEMYREKVDERQKKYLAALTKRLTVKKRREHSIKNKRLFQMLHRNLIIDNFAIYKRPCFSRCICTECFRYPKSFVRPEWW